MNDPQGYPQKLWKGLVVKGGAFGRMRMSALRHAYYVYSSVSMLPANAKQHSEKAIETSAGLLWPAKAELGDTMEPRVNVLLTWMASLGY